MMQPIKKRILWAFIIALVAVSSVSSECCDFYGSPCTWDTSSWRISSENPPNTAQYPNFVASENDPYFIYIQDQSGSTVSSSTFTIPSDGTVISFDYFLDSQFVDNDNYFYVEFYNSGGSYSTWLLTINTQNSNWQHAQVSCSYENNYCCGSLDRLPCSGTLRIVANVDATYQQALIAIDSIGTTCSTVPTTVTTIVPTTVTTTVSPTVPTTLPPPAPDCCSFKTDECGSIGTWLWSATSAPKTIIPNTNGNFDWTNVNGALWESAFELSVSTDTFFTFQYNIQSPLAELAISFKNLRSGLTFSLGSVTYVDATWKTYSTYCTACCGTGSVCDGQLIISSIISDSSEVAIDNFGRDNACYGSYACCLFNDPTICGSVSDSQIGYQWQFSGDQYPTNPVPNPGSNFVYFETVNYNYPYALNIGLRSETITINSNTAFRGYIYVYNPNYLSNSNSFTVYFLNIANGQLTQLSASFSQTLTTWGTYVFLCNSFYGNCCQGTPSCTGKLVFLAAVEASGGDATFAVDAFEIEGSCGTFPGSTNTKQVKFYQ